MSPSFILFLLLFVVLVTFVFVVLDPERVWVGFLVVVATVVIAVLATLSGMTKTRKAVVEGEVLAIEGAGGDELPPGDAEGDELEDYVVERARMKYRELRSEIDAHNENLKGVTSYYGRKRTYTIFNHHYMQDLAKMLDLEVPQKGEIWGTRRRGGGQPVRLMVPESIPDWTDYKISKR